jgi:DNA polymerase-3 subunit alpha
MVYDITVDNTHSYVLENIASSNSAGGSLVCYLLGITSIDPIKFELSFDRFLSPSRGGYMLNILMD